MVLGTKSKQPFPVYDVNDGGEKTTCEEIMNEHQKSKRSRRVGEEVVNDCNNVLSTRSGGGDRDQMEVLLRGPREITLAISVRVARAEPKPFRLLNPKRKGRRK